MLFQKIFQQYSRTTKSSRSSSSDVSSQRHPVLVIYRYNDIFLIYSWHKVLLRKFIFERGLHYHDLLSNGTKQDRNNVRTEHTWLFWIIKKTSLTGFSFPPPPSSEIGIKQISWIIIILEDLLVCGIGEYFTRCLNLWRTIRKHSRLSDTTY